MTGRPADTPNAADRAASGAVEAVLLDIDGTLLDSNDAHAQAWSDTLEEAGLQIGSETVRPLVGMGADKLLPQLTGIEADSETGQAVGGAAEGDLLQGVSAIGAAIPSRERSPRAHARGWSPPGGGDVGERG